MAQNTSKTKPRKLSNRRKLIPVAGTGRNKPAKGYNPVTKQWKRK